MCSESVWLVMRRRRSRRRTQTSRPTDMTLDSGGDLLLAYSDERLCLPSDNCSLRDTERSINQHELRNRTRAPVLPPTPTSPEKPWRRRLSQQLPVRILSLRGDSRWLRLKLRDLTCLSDKTPKRGRGSGGGGGVPLDVCQQNCP